MAAMNLVFVGLNGSVAALDRSTGTLVWATKLKGSDFVNVVQAEDEIYATTKGEVFCLDPATGQILWHNPLKGMGVGLVSIAGPGIQGNQAALVQKHKRDQEMAAAGATAGAAGSQRPTFDWPIRSLDNVAEQIEYAVASTWANRVKMAHS